jgi:hypothetical protein
MPYVVLALFLMASDPAGKLSTPSPLKYWLQRRSARTLLPRIRQFQ